ncbi:MAG: hypothetical protein IBX68_12165 [Dehalococcoidia bacterium]|nr:hypothetical protein [Dehalococcoidia bacterium]
MKHYKAEVAPAACHDIRGADKRFGHPHVEVTARLDEAVGEDRLYLTSVQGTIELVTDGQRLWVRTER